MHEQTKYTKTYLLLEEPFSNYSVDGSPEYAREISSLSLVNIFIGANNSGKSRFLRSLFTFRHTSSGCNAQIFSDLIYKLKDEFHINFPQYLHKVGNISRDHLQNIPVDNEKYFISTSSQIYKDIENKLKELASAKDEPIIRTNGVQTGRDPEGQRIAAKIREIGNKYTNLLQSIEFDPNLGGDKRYYIPILRGMRPLDDKHTDLYKERTINDYFKPSDISDSTQIFTGLELYQTLKEKLLGDPEDRALVKDFEDFLSENFFGFKPITLIPKEKGEDPRVVHIKIGDENQLPIYQLGDGLQSLIICTFTIFTEKERCLFFIEEPDMFMHPSMQRSFLEVLSRFDQHQYFITSHSNHFLDMTLDFANISVFHFSKIEGEQPQFKIRASSPRDRQVLLDLGVQNSSVFLTNATIWVEGITDRLYLRAYMEKYLKELENSNAERYKQLKHLKEDCHYSFVEYQGTNLVHWSFDSEDEDLTRIKANYVCAHAFLIADGDVATKGDREEVYKKMLGDRFHILEVKEIENLIPLEVLKKVVDKKFRKYRGNTSDIKCKDYMKEDIPIGQYLDTLLPDKKTVFSEDSGTIKSKGIFCDDAVKIMRDPDFDWTLAPELNDICCKLFDHIITQNKSQSK